MKKAIVLFILFTITFYANANKRKVKKHNIRIEPVVQLVDGNYILESLFNGINEIKMNFGKTSIVIANFSISCNVGCNTIHGVFQTEGTHVMPMKLISTEMYCESVDSLERQFVGALNKVDSLSVKGPLLTVYSKSKRVLVFKQNNY